MEARITAYLPSSPLLRGTRQAGLILLVALVPAILAALLHPRRPVWSRDQALVPEVEWSAVQQWSHPVVLIDARSAAAYAHAHIPKALLLDAGPGGEGVLAVAKAWQPGTRLVVYCDSPRCDAAQVVARRLRRELGLEDIVVLKGGWSAWIEARRQGR